MRLLVLALLVACAKKSAEPAVSGGGVTEPVVIVIDEDENELLGAELLQATAPCGNLLKLEPAAVLGKLSDGEVRCLEDTLRTTDRQTVKNKLSRVLLADAWAKGDPVRWEAVAERHLNQINRSDPNLAYKFSNHLGQRGADRADDAIRWADVALENRTLWAGDDYVKRVYALYRIKALASQAKWQALEEAAVRAPSEALLRDRDLARNQTKTFAREWLEYARVSSRDATVAMQICTSAAGTSAFCEGEREPANPSETP